jgi:hypothetical protein
VAVSSPRVRTGDVFSVTEGKADKSGADAARITVLSGNVIVTIHCAAPLASPYWVKAVFTPEELLKGYRLSWSPELSSARRRR